MHECHRPGPGGLPLALRLSEGLGVAMVRALGPSGLLLLPPVLWATAMVCDGADAYTVFFRSVEDREGIPSDRVQATTIRGRCSKAR